MCSILSFLAHNGDDDTKIRPPVQVAYVGGAVQIVCKFKKPIWRKDYAELRKDVVVQNNKLTIKVVNEHHDGVYICIDDRSGQLATSMLRVGCKCTRTSDI